MKEKTADIDILEEFIKHGGYQKNGMPISYIEIPYPLLRQAISNLISENKKLKEENKYLKSQIPIDKIFYYTYKDFIPKSKVEKEIDKLNKKEKDLQNSISDEEREEYSDASISFDLMDIDIRRETLQSILGKE